MGTSRADGDDAHGQEALLEALAGFPDELERAVAGQPKEALLRPGRDGGWGAIENLCHLRDWEEIFLERARAILARDRPELPAYDDELWEIERDYRGQDPGRVVQEFRRARGELVEALRGLEPADWERVGRHAVEGEITLRWLAEQALAHGDGHLRQIREVLS